MLLPVGLWSYEVCSASARYLFWFQLSHYHHHLLWIQRSKGLYSIDGFVREHKSPGTWITYCGYVAQCQSTEEMGTCGHHVVVICWSTNTGSGSGSGSSSSSTSSIQTVFNISKLVLNDRTFRIWSLEWFRSRMPDAVSLAVLPNSSSGVQLGCCRTNGPRCGYKDQSFRLIDHTRRS